MSTFDCKGFNAKVLVKLSTTCLRARPRSAWAGSFEPSYIRWNYDCRIWNKTVVSLIRFKKNKLNSARGLLWILEKSGRNYRKLFLRPPFLSHFSFFLCSQQERVAGNRRFIFRSALARRPRACVFILSNIFFNIANGRHSAHLGWSSVELLTQVHTYIGWTWAIRRKLSTWRNHVAPRALINFSPDPRTSPRQGLYIDWAHRRFIVSIEDHVSFDAP